MRGNEEKIMSPAAKMAHWLRHECKTSCDDLEERISTALARKNPTAALEKVLASLKVKHPMADIAVKNTVNPPKN
ncbi:MAG: hypothetical protein P1P81_04415 [Desulfobulbales bacterium]|nr:hypothetical protein [Desulfobulbales bacterium]